MMYAIMCCTRLTRNNVEYYYYYCLDNAVIFITESPDPGESEGSVLILDTRTCTLKHTSTHFI